MTRLPARIETAIVGAGQAGLTMSRHLQRAGRDHVVLERRATLGGGWQDRWDRFRLVGPNWTASFLDAPYDGDDPDGYMPRDEIIDRVSRYAATIAAPVVLEAGVDRLRRVGDVFVLDTTQGALAAREVIVAIGGFHRPRVPPIADGLGPRVLSLHAQAYRREADLPAGAVLVVGSGQTGVQLVEELRAAGRDVYLSVGTTGRAPRHYRGKDMFFWLWQLGERGAALGAGWPTVDQLPDPRRRLAGNPHLSGHDGGHETDLRAIGRAGTTLLGRLAGIDGERVRLAPDVRANLDAADRFFGERLPGSHRPVHRSRRARLSARGAAARVDFEPPMIEELDLRRAGVGTVLWTTGYRQDLHWIDLPITDEMGFPRQVRGVSEIARPLLPRVLWQHDQTSATLFGMPRDARVLADRMGLRVKIGDRRPIEVRACSPPSVAGRPPAGRRRRRGARAWSRDRVLRGLLHRRVELRLLVVDTGRGRAQLHRRGEGTDLDRRSVARVWPVVVVAAARTRRPSRLRRRSPSAGYPRRCW